MGQRTYGDGVGATDNPDWPQWPDDLPILRRQAVRVVVRDAQGSVLLFRTRDIAHPDLGLWWELPGGGLDEAETYLEAAVREIREEAGLAIDPALVGPPLWRRTASFKHRQVRHVQEEVVVAAQLGATAPHIDVRGRLDYENEDYVDFGWWTVADIQRSGERFYPGRLPALIAPFLAGEEFDEPFELFS
ncbi:MAG: putative MutT/nudix-family hydrolase [Jatrophihabitantaceae bacterium]|nr:putative MutT/nudix-family hydrolase [Jatrophihabitantaceae bacterium]